MSGQGPLIPLIFLKIKVLLPTKRKIKLKTNSSDTVNSVKAQIQADEHFPSDEQTLIFRGTVLDDGHSLLSEYGIRRDSLLRLKLPVNAIPLTIRVLTPSRRRFKLRVYSNDTINSVKTKILAQEKIPVDQQTLRFQGRLLDEGSRWLSAYGIRHKSAIKVTLPIGGNVTLHFSDTNFPLNNLFLVMKPYETVGNVKIMLQDRIIDVPERPYDTHYDEDYPTRVRPHLQSLYLPWLRSALEDDKPLAYYYIQDHQRIRLEWEVPS